MLRQHRVERAALHAFLTLVVTGACAFAGSFVGALASVLLFGFDSGPRPEDGALCTLLGPGSQGILAGSALGLVLTRYAWRRVQPWFWLIPAATALAFVLAPARSLVAVVALALVPLAGTVCAVARPRAAGSARDG